MPYTFSFNSAPPSGFSINPQTGLITIAANATPFTGNLSVKVSDGVSTAIKSIPIVLTAPSITPLLSTVSRVKHRCGGRVVAIPIDINPVIHHGGGRMFFAISTIPVLTMTHRAGTQQTVGFNEEATPIGVIEVQVSSAGGDYASYLSPGISDVLVAIVQRDWDSSGVNQGVVWEVVPSEYSSYGSISVVGSQCSVTVNNGTFLGVSFEVKATSVAFPSASRLYTVYTFSRIDSIQINSPSIVGANQAIAISGQLVGAGQGIGPGSAAAALIYFVIVENGNYTYLYGENATYTSGGNAGTIQITAGITGRSSSETKTIQNTGASSGLTIVPNYIVTHTGGPSWDSLSWATLNDSIDTTGAGVGSGSGDATIVVNLGSPLLIKKIEIAGGELPGLGDLVSDYLNGGFLEYSANGTLWTTYASISGVVDIVGVFKSFLPNITAQYWRIRHSSYCATSAFVFYT